MPGEPGAPGEKDTRAAGAIYDQVEMEMLVRRHRATPHGRRSRQFSIARFGREGAFRQALAVRAAWEARYGVTTAWKPETLELNRAAQIEAWADPARRARASARAKKQWRDPAVRAKRLAGLRRSMTDPVVRARQIANLRAHHACRKEKGETCR
jgi:hypothetical protein